MANSKDNIIGTNPDGTHRYRNGSNKNDVRRNGNIIRRTKITPTDNNPITRTFNAPQSPRYYKPNGGIVNVGEPLHQHQDGTIMTKHVMGRNNNSVVVTTSRARNVNHNQSRGGNPNIETINVSIPEGNNFISFPYQIVNNSINYLQNQNPHITFDFMTGGEYGNQGIFDMDGDGFMESGNLNTIDNRYSYWLNISGVENNMTDIFEMDIDVYQSDEPISHQLIGAGYTCGNRTISYDGIDGLSTLDALGTKAPFIQKILSQGQGIWNTCLEQYFDNLDAGMDHWENTYNYSDDCWEGNLTQLEVGVGYWINLFCPGTSGNADAPSPHNMNEYSMALGGGFTQTFNNFQWERSSPKPPKRIKPISDKVVKDKIRLMGIDDKLVESNVKPKGWRNTNRVRNRPYRNNRNNFGAVSGE